VITHKMLHIIHTLTYALRTYTYSEYPPHSGAGSLLTSVKFFQCFLKVTYKFW